MLRFALPIVALWRRELIRFWRERSRVFGFVGSPLVFWFFIGSGFGDLRTYFPGFLLLTVIFGAAFSTMSLIEDRREGFLLSVLAAPVPRTALVLGKTLGAATLAWVQGLLFLAFLPLAGISAAPAGVLGAACLLFLVALTFTALGFAVAWKVNSTAGYHGIINLLIMPLWIVSGSVFPRATASGWLQVLMDLNPVSYALSGLRQLLLREPFGPAPGVSVGLLSACCLLLLAASVMLARRRTTGEFA